MCAVVCLLLSQRVCLGGTPNREIEMREIGHPSREVRAFSGLGRLFSDPFHLNVVPMIAALFIIGDERWFAPPAPVCVCVCRHSRHIAGMGTGKKYLYSLHQSAKVRQAAATVNSLTQISLC